MWPKFLDMTRDECRGVLRRLELESYSCIVGTFRAQGRLSNAKQKMLKDLREALHIPEDRHKAEIRKAVNDEVFSTIAKSISGPNTEIEWHKEGDRGFPILPRNPPQTALSSIADKASKQAEEMNSTLPNPEETHRERKLEFTQNDDEVKQLVTFDPTQVTIDPKRERTTPTSFEQDEQSKKRRASTKISMQSLLNNIKNSPKKVSPTTNSTKRSKQKKSEESAAPKPILHTRRRESVKPKAASTTNENEQVTSTSPDLAHELENISEQNHRQTTPASIRSTNPKPTVDNNVSALTAALPEESREILATASNTRPETTNVDKAFIAAPPSPLKLPISQNVVVEATSNRNSLKFVDASSVIIRSSPQVNKTPAIVNVGIKSSGTLSKQLVIKQSAGTVRIPPKINILSQHTLAKGSVNYIPMTDNNIIIKSDSKLATAIKSQQIQILPSQNNIIKPNMIIRGTNANATIISTSTVANAQMRLSTLPGVASASNNYQRRNSTIGDRNVYVLNVQPSTNIHQVDNSYNDIIENDTEVITEEVEGAEYVVEENPSYEIHTDNNQAYKTIYSDDLPRPAKISRLSNTNSLVQNHQGNHVYNKYQTINVNKNVNQNYVMSSVPIKAQLVHRNVKAQAVPIQRVVYEETPADWEYKVEERKQPIISSSSDSLSQVNHIIRSEEYANSPTIIYEEVLSSDNITEEYVTTEEYSGNDDLIEMDSDSGNHDGHQFVYAEETNSF